MTPPSAPTCTPCSSAPPRRVVLLSTEHDRGTFASGCEPLDSYFRQRVTQDIRRRVAARFVAIAPDDRVAGYYTLASANLALAALPPETARKLPRYPTIPAVRLGCLAVDHGFRGQGLRGAMLADALARAMRSEIAAFAMTVDAKDETASTFCLHHGFIPLPNLPMTPFLPLATASP